jgi:signal transduction histidine kinase/ActR/RegA family two-component response regulator
MIPLATVVVLLTATVIVQSVVHYRAQVAAAGSAHAPAAARARVILLMTAGGAAVAGLGVLGVFHRLLGRVERDLARATGGRERAVARGARAVQKLAHVRDQIALLERQSAMAAELERARAQAEAASRAKTAVLANVAREVRTPTTAILGYADLLAADPATAGSAERRAAAVAVIRRNGDHLLALVNDVLDLSQIAAGAMAVERAPCALGPLVDRAAAEARRQAGEKGLAFAVEYGGAADGPSPDDFVHTDAHRVRQALGHLLANAVKFTPAGSVRLVVSRESTATADAPRLRFDVMDTGVGISDDQRPALFQPFTQGDGSNARRFGGAGLGLSIAKGLATLLGGDVTFTSRPREGSCFSLVIDVAPPAGGQPAAPDGAAAAAAPPTAAPAPAGPLRARVLLVEDAPDNQLLIGHHLRAAGADVTVAENGAVGLNQALVAAAAGAPFDLILMDMQMPYMDGYTAAAALRSQGIGTPIVALTANAMPEDRAKCVQAGCTDYLSKPVDRRALLAAVRRHVAATVTVPHAA